MVYALGLTYAAPALAVTPLYASALPVVRVSAPLYAAAPACRLWY